LLVTDMQMPVMDGYTLARTLRGRRSTIPIIALTAHAMAEDRQRCSDAGCDDYATKPIEQKSLIAACARWMGVIRDQAPGHDHAADQGVLDPDQSADVAQASVDDKPDPSGAPANGDDAVLLSELLEDPDMLLLVEGFLVLLAERMTRIEQHRTPMQRPELTSLAHQLKGAAGGYGFPTITEAARAVERFAGAGGTQREVDDAIAALGALCRAAVRGRGAAADTLSCTTPPHPVSVNAYHP